MTLGALLEPGRADFLHSVRLGLSEPEKRAVIQVVSRFAALHDSSHREGTICLLCVLGLSDKEIGAALDLSPRTVETYVERASGKCSAIDRADLRARIFRFACVSWLTETTMELHTGES